MTRNRLPWTLKLIEVLTPPEGEEPKWISVQELTDSAGPLIPDERAEKARRINEYSTLAPGRRYIIAQSIHSLANSKRVELQYGMKHNKRVVDKVRLTPQGITDRPRLREDVHPWTEKIVEILGDNEWWDYEKFMAIASPYVPPGMAWRQAEQRRQTHYKSVGKPFGERVRGGRVDTIKTGQREIIIRSLRSLRNAGRIEVEYGTQSVKKRPVRLRLKP